MAILEPSVDFEQGPEMGLFYSGQPNRSPNTIHRNAYLLSEAFWTTHADLLGEDGNDPGVVLQYSETNGGEIVNYDDEAGQEDVHTLQFRSSGEGSFTWQHTKANKDGRITRRIILKDGTLSEITQQRFDSQGRLAGTESIGIGSFYSTMHTIRRVLESEFFSNKVKEIRERRQRAEQHLSRFAIEGLLQYAPKKYDELLEGKEEAKNRARFTPLDLYG